MQPIVPDGVFYIRALVPEGHPPGSTIGLPAEIRQLVDMGELKIDPRTVDRTDYNISRNWVFQNSVASILNSAFFSEDNDGKDHLAQNCIRFAFCHADDVLARAGGQLRNTKE